MRRIIILGLLLTAGFTSVWGQNPNPPERNANNLIVASYNIKWLNTSNHDFNLLARVIQHFDVCGILEIKNERALPMLVDALEDLTHEDWGYVCGVRTHRPGGRYYEAYGAVWRKDRAELGDGVISNVWDLEEAFRNDPYIVSFRRQNFDFLLLLVHTRWSDDDEGTRENEVNMVADHVVWMSGFLPERDFVVAGDFNYEGDADPLEGMAQQAGLSRIDPNQRSTFRTNSSGYANSYDHVYVSTSQTTEFTGRSGVLDVTQLVYGNRSRENMDQSKERISDHLPVWVEFNVTGPDDD